MHLKVGVTAIACAALMAVAPSSMLAKGSKEGSKFKIPLVGTGVDPDASGVVDFSSGKGRSRFRVSIKNGPPRQLLELWVGGISRGTVTSSSNGSASFQFGAGSSSGKGVLLDFDPRGQVVDIEDANDVVFLTSEGQGGGNPAGTALAETTFLSPTGIQPGAKGRATLNEKKGQRNFEVEIENVANGAYTLVVDGVERGTINVSAGNGQIEFEDESGDDNPGSENLPLDFDPYGKLIQVLLGSDVILTGEMLATAPGVNVCSPSEVTTPFTNVGPDGDASGDSRLRVRENCRRDFRVEIEDLPVGDYDLVVDSVIRATISVVNVVGGTEGEVEFSTDLSEQGKLPLDFDPSGATIDIKQGDTTFLSSTGGSPDPGSCNPMDVEPDLDNIGPDGNAQGKARFRQESDCDKDFRVEVENLSVGAYELLVDGIVRGTINVVLVQGEEEGEIEFDNDPNEVGKILLTFDPRGKLVVVRQGATEYLSVTIPE